MAAPAVHVLSAGSALPGPPVGNDALAHRFGMDALWEQWVDTFIGTRTRHLAVDLDSGEVRHSLADLAETAARHALTAASLAPADVDAVVLATATPDQLMPATVNVVADRLGIDGVPTYQLQSGCAGAVQALDLGRLLLAAGGLRTVLVLGGDVCAKHFDLGVDLAGLRPSELVNVVLFGDGAGAAVLSADPAPGAALVHRVLNRLTGAGRAPGQTLDWFGPAAPPGAGAAVSEDYKAVEAAVPGMAKEIVAELLDGLGWCPADVDHLLPPQLSGTMTARIVDGLAIPAAREVTLVRETGNNGNAMPFLQLERALPDMLPGDRAIGVAVESSKWIKAGFAVEKI